MDGAEKVHVDPSGVPRYLTSIVSSSLTWIDEQDRETIWESASLCLSERSGRTAAPSMTRAFNIDDKIILSLYEPSMTEDSLGLKTWTSSLLLSRRLSLLSRHVPPHRPRMLELGSGTGLVGIAAAHIWKARVSEVLLTDLPEIVPNLKVNIVRNTPPLSGDKCSVCRLDSRVLDWADETDTPIQTNDTIPLIVAADPIYSAEHPSLFVNTVQRWLARGSFSRFILELPLRDGYSRERTDLRQRLESFMCVVEEGEEVGYDDWEDADGRPAEVTCWWSVWRLLSDE